ncbi:MAG: DUF29 domain-containing protein [Sciscionella sp.]
MSATTKTLYETDFAAWAGEMAAALRARAFDELDLENLAEEIEGLAIAQRKAVRSQLQRLMLHLLKQQLQPERDGASWRVSIISARNEILDDIEDSPSLRAHLEQNIQRVYRFAIEEALGETGSSQKLPARCPWTLDELLAQRQPR